MSKPKTPPRPAEPAVGPNRAERRRRWAKLADGADYLGITDRTLRAMIADGRITGYRNGPRIVRVDLNELDECMSPFGGSV